jgi:hypothetical protein
LRRQGRKEVPHPTALAGLTPPAVAQTSGDVLVIEGLALPQSHRYEIYNASAGTRYAAAGQTVTQAKPAPSGEWQRIHSLTTSR